MTEPTPPMEFTHSETINKVIEEQISICSKEGDFFNWTAMKNVLDNSRKFNGESMYILLTVVSIVEQLTTGRSSLENYQDSDFGSFSSVRSKVKPTAIS